MTHWTAGERAALIKRIIAYEELTLRLFDRLLANTPTDHPEYAQVTAADRALRTAQVLATAIGQPGTEV